MSNTIYNKITINNDTLIDLSQDTVTSAAHIVSGYVGHLADGTQVTGTGSGGSGGTYVRTTNYPLTTITPNSDRSASLTGMTPLEDGESYIITYDGTEWLCTVETINILTKRSIPYNKVLDTYVSQSTGEDIDYNGWTATDFIDVSNMHNLYVYTDRSSSYNVFYDVNKEYISWFWIRSGQQNEISVPSNAKYARLSNASTAAVAVIDTAYLNSLDSKSLYLVGDYNLLYGNSEDYNAPFCVNTDTVSSESEFIGLNTSQHTLKVEKLVFIDDGVTLVNKTVTSNGIYDPDDDNADGYSSVTVNVSTGTPRTSSDLTVSGATVTAPAGYYAEAASKSVASGTEGTPTATKGTVSNHSVSITPSVTNTAGYISGGTKTGTVVSVSASELVSGTLNVDSAGTKDVTNYASASIPSGTAGTPTATKGTVSNHSISITPSVTNTAGYISGSTKTGTAVSVSASELVSGNKEITSNGSNIDVAEYATVSVNVAASSKNFQVASGGNRVATTSYTAVSGQELTVAVTGTYNVYWSGYRSSTGGTNGSWLYIGDSAYGSVNTTFSNNLQTVKLTGVSLTKDQVVTVRARARGTSYYMYVSNLTIEQTA